MNPSGQLVGLAVSVKASSSKAWEASSGTMGSIVKIPTPVLMPVKGFQKRRFTGIFGAISAGFRLLLCRFPRWFDLIGAKPGASDQSTAKRFAKRALAPLFAASLAP